MKKSFRKQMEAVITERYMGDLDTQHRYLDESTTPAAETLITFIRQWPEQVTSRNQALGRLVECDRWNDKGELVLETDFKGKAYPVRLPLAMAYEAYQFGDQRKQYWPNYSFPNSLKRIPANVTNDWAEEIKGLFGDMGRLSLNAIRSISLGKWVKMYGINNPHTFAGWQREVEEWNAAQKAIDEFVMTRKGWEYLTSAKLQNPDLKKEMSKILEDILAKADEAVEPSLSAIREQDRRLYIRQDATKARNNVKALSAFFKKYGLEKNNALTLLSDNIDHIETQTLVNRNK